MTKYWLLSMHAIAVMSIYKPVAQKYYQKYSWTQLNNTRNDRNCVTAYVSYELLQP